jgi:hypothetical protein
VSPTRHKRCPAPSRLCRALLAILLYVGTACPSGTAHAKTPPFDFALIGDVPYSEEDTTNGFVNLVQDLNRADLRFVVHNGDLKSGSAPCSEALLAERYGQFQTFKHPLVYLFGDNEWTDCGRSPTNRFTPEEWLAKLREVFTRGDQSLGARRLLLSRQSDDPRFAAFRENVRWTCGPALFAGFNVPGDVNNFGQPEFTARNAANLAWLEESFALARQKGLSALMLIMQANPRFELAATNRLRAGFNDLLKTLERETVAFRKPVVLVHGDSHYFRIDKPLLGRIGRRRIENFTRVETFGYPDIHWVRVTVDADDANVFTFRPVTVEKNCVKH